MENKCSRQSLCQNGDSVSSMRWIPSDSSLEASSRCIINIITPDHFLLDNQQVVSHISHSLVKVILFVNQLSVSVGGPGLPAKLRNETYSCYLEESLGRFNITVPAVEVNPSTDYTCNITNRVPDYEGIQAGEDSSVTYIVCMGHISEM